MTEESSIAKLMSASTEKLLKPLGDHEKYTVGIICAAAVAGLQLGLPTPVVVGSLISCLFICRIFALTRQDHNKYPVNPSSTAQQICNLKTGELRAKSHHTEQSHDMDTIIQQIRTSDPGDIDIVEIGETNPVINPSNAGPAYGDGDTLYPTPHHQTPPASEAPRHPHPAKSPHVNVKTYKYINELVDIDRDPKTGLLGKSYSGVSEINSKPVDKKTLILEYIKNYDWNETIETNILLLLASLAIVKCYKNFNN